MIQTKIGKQTPLQLQLFDGDTGKFPVAYLKNSSGTIISVHSLTHVNDGMYISSFIPTVEGFFHATFRVFSNAARTIEDFTYEIITENYYVENSALTNEAIADAVWDEIMHEHNIPNSFGLNFQVVRQFSEVTVNEIVNPVTGLIGIHSTVVDEANNIIEEVNNNEIKIDQITPSISIMANSINNNIDQNQLILESMIIQAQADRNYIESEILVNRTKIDQMLSSISALSNNTTVRFIVPETLVKPESGSKTYQFHLRLFDDNGNPINADSIPLIRIRSLVSGLDIINNSPMTEEPGKTGSYFYNQTITAAAQLENLLVEATIVQQGITKYIPATTEIVEYSTDLNDIQHKIGLINNNVLINKSILENPVSGLTAIRNKEDEILNKVTENGVKIDAIGGTVATLPSNIATRSDVDEVLNLVNTRPLLSEIVAQLNLLESQIKGPGGRNITDVFNKIDFTSLMKTNDPRLNNLDTTISSRSTITTEQIWSYATRTLTDLTIPSSEILKIWNHLVSQITVPGSIGKRIVSYLDVAVSTRATQSQVSSLLSDVAKESSVQAVLAKVLQGIASNAISFADILALLNVIKPKTDFIPANPSTQQDVTNTETALALLLNNLTAINNAIKNKTDNLPIDPAREGSVLSIPRNPVLVNDARLSYLDVPISSRSTLKLSDFSDFARKNDLLFLEGVILSAISSSANLIRNDILTRLSTTQFLSRMNMTDSRIDFAVDQIIDEINSIDFPSGGGSVITPASIWSYSNRSLTTPFPNISNLATKTDVTNASSASYINKMGTTFRPATNDQEMIVWAEKNGERVASTSNCIVTVKDSTGNTKWTSTSSSPNSDGIYRFVHPIAISADNNYYVIISIKVDGKSRITQQAFFTIG